MLIEEGGQSSYLPKDELWRPFSHTLVMSDSCSLRLAATLPTTLPTTLPMLIHRLRIPNRPYKAIQRLHQQA